jgi:hypothetical protein
LGQDDGTEEPEHLADPRVKVGGHPRWAGLIFPGEAYVEALKRFPIGKWLPPVGAGSLHRQDHAVHGATRSGNLVFDSSKKHGLGKVANSTDQHGAPRHLGECMVQKRVADPQKAIQPLVSW